MLTTINRNEVFIMMASHVSAVAVSAVADIVMAASNILTALLSCIAAFFVIRDIKKTEKI